MTRRITVRQAALATLLLALPACTTTTGATYPSAPVAATATTVSPAPGTDAYLALQAAQDSLAEVQLAQLALRQSSNSAVRQFAQRILDDHARANAQLAPIAQALGLTMPMAMDEPHGALVTKLSTLHGAPFDTAFVDQMIGDHAKAVAMFERMAVTATDPTFREWARQQIPVLRQHYTATASLYSELARGVTSATTPSVTVTPPASTSPSAAPTVIIVPPPPPSR